MKQQYGAQSCALLQINSNIGNTQNSAIDNWSPRIARNNRGLTIALRETRDSASPEPVAIAAPTKTSFSVDGEDLLVTNGTAEVSRSESLSHALSTTDLSAIDDPLSNSEFAVAADSVKLPNRGLYLTVDDCERISAFVDDFVTKSLVPYVERQMRVLHDQMQSRKGFGKGLFDGLKKNRWFGGSSATLQATANTSAAPSPTHAASIATLTTISNNVSSLPPSQMDSTEGQLRRLADLAFLVQQYGFAFYVFNVLRKEMQNDPNSLAFANICEMCALSAFLAGQLAIGKPYPQHYMDVALRGYRDFAQHHPGLTIRATLFDIDIRRSQQRHEEAHAALVEASSLSANDVYSAMLLEQAAVCLRDMNKTRRMSFRLILAGYRYNKAQMRTHSLRCYNIALHNHRDTVTLDAHWRHAIDHIDYTRAHDLRHSAASNEAIDSALNRLFAYRKTDQYDEFDTHLPTLHALALLEYSQAAQQLKQTDPDYIAPLPFPHVDAGKIETFIDCSLDDLTAYEQLGDGQRVNVSKGDEAFAAPNADDNVPWQYMHQAILQTRAGTSKDMSHLPTSFHNEYTDNSKSTHARPRDTWRVRLPLINQLAVPITLSMQRLVVDGAHDLLHQDAEPVTLAPRQTAHQDLILVPVTPGQYKVVAWTFTISVAVKNRDPIVIAGRQMLTIHGRRLNRTKQHKSTPHYDADYRLHLSVTTRGEQASTLDVDLAPLNPHDALGVQPSFSGQLYPVPLVLRSRTNSDEQSTPIINVHLCAWPCQSIALQDNSGKRLPTTLWEEESEYALPCDRRQVVWSLVNESAPIHPAGQKSFTLLLKAPATQSSHTIRLLFVASSLDRNGHEHISVSYRTLRMITRPSVSVQARALACNTRDTMLCSTQLINKCDSAVVSIQSLRISLVQPFGAVGDEHRRWRLHSLIASPDDTETPILYTGQSTNICSTMIVDRSKFDPDMQVSTRNSLSIDKQPDIVSNYAGCLPWASNVLLNARDTKAHNQRNHYVVLLWQGTWPSPSDASQKVTVLGESWAALIFPEQVENIPPIIISKLALRLDEEKRQRGGVVDRRSPTPFGYTPVTKHPIQVTMACLQQQPIRYNFSEGSCTVPMCLYVERKDAATPSEKYIITIDTAMPSLNHGEQEQQLNTGLVFINGSTRKPLLLKPGDVSTLDFDVEFTEAGSYDLRQTINIGYIKPGRTATSIPTALPLTREQAPIVNVWNES